jgi:hypothetical protein
VTRISQQKKSRVGSETTNGTSSSWYNLPAHEPNINTSHDVLSVYACIHLHVSVKNTQQPYARSFGKYCRFFYCPSTLICTIFTSMYICLSISTINPAKRSRIDDDVKIVRADDNEWAPTCLYARTTLLATTGGATQEFILVIVNNGSQMLQWDSYQEIS